MKNQEAIELLNAALEHELSGVVRYTHYSLMVFGPNRIPIVKWLQGNAHESLVHAEEIGEHITTLGGHPSLKIAKLLETEKHSVKDILTESIEHEKGQLEIYARILKNVEGKSVFLEEWSRKMITEEEQHLSEMEKMIRTP